MKFTLAVLLAFGVSHLVCAQPVIKPSGHVDLFNGRDFAGWTFCMKGDSNPLATWSVTNGVIHCTGKPTGYLRTVAAYQDYVLTVEWRFVKVAPKQDNTGILVNMQLPDKVWPTCVQVQGKHTRQGDLFLMAGAESKEHRGQDANTALPLRGTANEHPVGEWDTVRTTSDHGTVTTWVNDRLMNATTECTVTNGFIGIQSEGGELEIRRLSLDPLPVN